MGPIEKVTLWEGPIEKITLREGPIEKVALWERPIEKITLWEGPIEKVALWERPIEKVALWGCPIEKVALWEGLCLMPRSQTYEGFVKEKVFAQTGAQTRSNVVYAIPQGIASTLKHGL